MKKILLAFVATLLSVCVVAGAAGADVQILNDTKIIRINENYGIKTNLTVTIAPKSQTEINSERLPSFIYLYTSDDNGLFSDGITLSSNWESGVYTAYIDAYSDGRSFDFIYVNPESVATLEVVASINSCAQAQQIYNVLIQSDGAAKLGIDKNSEQFVSAAFDALDYVCRKKDGDFTYSTFMKLFNDGCEVSQLLDEIKSCEVYGELQNIIEPNIGVLDIELDEDYNKVETKSKIYVEMFNNLNNITGYSSVASWFKNAVKTVLNSQKENKPSNDSPSGKRPTQGGSVVIPTTDPVVTNPINPAPVVAAYSDLVGHFSETAVNELSQKKVLSGYPDGTFKPSNSVTRAEFAKVVALAFGYEPGVTGAFNDVKANDWFAGFVDALNAEGIVGGYEGKFNPNETLTRQDAACIIYRILKDDLTLSEKEAFSDEEDVSDYAKDAVSSLHKAGVVNGNNNMFNPLSTITRGEVAVMVSNAVNSALK